ncbi:hypothetical protein EV1_010622 [Malus domestica]
MLKKDKGKLGIPEKPTIIGTPGLDLVSLGLVDVEKIPKYNLTVEGGRKLAKENEYSRCLLPKFFMGLGNDEASPCKAGSRVHTVAVEAIEALPGHLKAAALVPDLTPFPVKRFTATLTPPIEGYIDRVKEAARKSSAKEKLR